MTAEPCSMHAARSAGCIPSACCVMPVLHRPPVTSLLVAHKYCSVQCLWSCALLSWSLQHVTAIRSSAAHDSFQSLRDSTVCHRRVLLLCISAGLLAATSINQLHHSCSPTVSTACCYCSIAHACPSHRRACKCCQFEEHMEHISQSSQTCMRWQSSRSWPWPCDMLQLLVCSCFCATSSLCCAAGMRLALMPSVLHAIV